MGKIAKIQVAAVVLASVAVGGAASAFADSYYQGADPNPTYVNKVRQLDGHIDHARTSSVAASTAAAPAAPVKHHTKLHRVPAQG